MKKNIFSWILFLTLAGFLLAVGIIEGMSAEGAHIMRGHAERVAILNAAGQIK